MKNRDLRWNQEWISVTEWATIYRWKVFFLKLKKRISNWRKVPSAADLLTNEILKSADKVYWITGWRNGRINKLAQNQSKPLSLKTLNKAASLSKNGTKHRSWMKTINFDPVNGSSWKRARHSKKKGFSHHDRTPPTILQMTVILKFLTMKLNYQVTCKHYYYCF